MERLNKIKKHFKSHKYFYMIVAITLLIVFVIAAVYKVKVDVDSRYVNYDLTDEVEVKKNEKRLQKTSFVDETAYDGAKVPYILYDIPFITDEDKNIIPGADDSYFTNKELVQNMGRENLQQFIDASEEYLNLLFNNNYRDIAADTDAFVGEYTKLNSMNSQTITTTLENSNMADEEGNISPDVLASKYAEMYVDNSLTIDSTFYTDTSLVYFKYYMYWVRGLISITPTSADHEAGEVCEPLKEMFNIDVKYGETVNFIVDVGIFPTDQLDVSSITFSTVEK